MPERPRRPDLDERFTLDPLTGEEVLERQLGTEDDEEAEKAPEADET